MAAAKKRLSPQEQRDAQKQAKQKKILLILGPLLLIAVAIQIPKLLGGSEEPAADEAAAVEGAEAGESAPPASPAAPAEPGESPDVPGDPLAGGGLV